MSEYPFDYIEDYYETHIISKALFICNDDHELKNIINGLEDQNHSVATLYDVNNKIYRILCVTISEYVLHKQDLFNLDFSLVIIGNVNDNDYNAIMYDVNKLSNINILNLY